MSLVLCDLPPSVAMSASPQKLPASNITCRYWATSGTCFFGDQCNFAHNIADRASSGKSVPKREKACKELLLTGYCKNEKNGCEYNHDISGLTRSGPLSAYSTTTATVPSPVVLSSWTTSNSRVVTSASLSPGTAASVRSKRLPASAPAFVPAAVAAAQRASLSAWGGVTPGSGKNVTAVTSQATYATTSSVPTLSQIGSLTSPQQTSGVDAPATTALAVQVQESEVSITLDILPTSTFTTSSLPLSLNLSILNAQPFVPSGASSHGGYSNGTILTTSGSIQGPTSIGSANATPFVPSGGSVASAVSAAPFVPKSRQHLSVEGAAGVGALHTSRALPSAVQHVVPVGSSAPQQLQIRQQSPQLQQQAAAQAAAQAQVQAQAHILAAAARNIGNVMSSSQYMEVPMVIPPFRLPDGDDPALGMTAMSPPNPAFLSRAQQLHQHMQKLQLQQQHQAFSGQSPPYSLRPPQKPGPKTPEKQQQQNSQAEHIAFTGQSSPFSWLPQKLGAQTPEKTQLLATQLEASPKLETRSSSSPSLVLSSDKQSQEHAVLSPERRDSEQSSGTLSEPNSAQQSPQQEGQAQSLQQQSHSTQQSLLKQQQQAQLQQQIQLHAQQQQQLRHKLQQQQQQMQLIHQLSQVPRTSPGQSQQRLPPSSQLRSSSPVSGVAPVAAATHGGATYFLGPGQGISSLPHAFTSPGGRNESRISRGPFSSGIVPLGSRFLPDQLREELRRRHSLIHAQLDPEQDLVDLPEMVQRYHSLYPLEDVIREEEAPSSSLGVRTMIFKGVSSSDGQAYAIRRIDSRQVIPTAELAATAVETVERWAPLARHPHIVAIKESFVSRELEDTPALFFVHDFYPGAVTLQALHLQQEQAGGVVHLTVTEEQLWSYMVQLATVVRVVHGAGLFFRPGGLHPSKIIVPSKGRLRISGVGILDVLHGDPADDPRIFQREDLAGFGRLILTLACGSAVNASLDFMASHYSPDLVRITQALLAEKSEGVGISSIRQLYSVLAERMFGEIENLHIQNDEVMNELSKETENGRLLRILVKLGMMNERPDNDMDPNWSETGDRYLLKLFRDFVFHQTSEEGAPIIDWGHITECLNKLDAGVPEKLILLSRDERSMLIASYADLKRCLESVYQDLLVRASGDKTRPILPQNMLRQSQGHVARLGHRQSA